MAWSPSARPSKSLVVIGREFRGHYLFEFLDFQVHVLNRRLWLCLCCGISKENAEKEMAR